MIPTDRSFWLLDWFRWSVSLSLEVKIRLRETLNRRTDLLGCLVTVCCCWTCFWWLKCLRSTHIGHQTPSPKLPKQVEGHQLILKDSFWNFEYHSQRKGIFDYFQEVFYMPIILLMYFRTWRQNPVFQAASCSQHHHFPSPNGPTTVAKWQDSLREVENQLRTVKLMIKCAQARRKAGEATLRLVLDKLEMLGNWGKQVSALSPDLIITNHVIHMCI